MGATMMPLFTSALKTLKAHEVARGSTLLNITQQIASSVGVASCRCCSPTTSRPPSSPDRRWPRCTTRPWPPRSRPPRSSKGLEDAASAFAQTYWVAWAMVLLTLIPALLLPRKHEETHLLDEEGIPPVIVH